MEISAAIFLGASKFPNIPSFSSPSFQNSKRDFEDYLRQSSPSGLGIKSGASLDLFDLRLDPGQQLKKIIEFLRELKQEYPDAIRNLIIYYCGHGYLAGSGGREYFLALAQTDHHVYDTTGLRFASLGDTLRQSAKHFRCFYILDCEFAGQALSTLFDGGGSGDADVPRRGTAALCATSGDDDAPVPQGQRRTVFTDALVEVLAKGDQVFRDAMTLTEVRDLAWEFIREKYKDAEEYRIRPYLGSPDQTEGDIATNVQLFPNPSSLRIQQDPRWQAQQATTLRQAKTERQAVMEISAAVFLGASKYPNIREFSNPSLKNSKSDFEDYLREHWPSGLGVTSSVSLDLFDLALDPGEQLKKIVEFLDELKQGYPNAIRNLIVYYCGHCYQAGVDGREHFLALAQTDRQVFDMTGLRFTSLTHVLKQRAKSFRYFYILDCFADQALEAFEGDSDAVARLMTAPLRVEGPRVAAEVPRRGAAALCGVSPDTTQGHRRTFFTDALIKVLATGDKELRDAMTLSEVHDLAWELIHEEYKDFKEAQIRPYLGSPDQSEGDIAEQVLLFPNPSFPRAQPHVPAASTSGGSALQGEDKAKAAPSPDRILAIVLGAGWYALAPTLSQRGSSFENSARDLRQYLLRPKGKGLGLPFENMIYLFDDGRSAVDQLRDVGDFLKRRIQELKKAGKEATDLIVYYVGHGLFSNTTYYLAIRATDAARDSLTSIRVSDLAQTINHEGHFLRKFLILDACFAGAAQRDFQSAALQASRAQVFKEMPAHGTSLLCAASANDPAKAPEGLPRTMFSDSLLKGLEEGDSKLGTYMSLFDLGALVRLHLKESFPDTWVRPEIHSPNQREGDVANVPLFPNPRAAERSI